jgi:hypothetical protein
LLRRLYIPGWLCSFSLKLYFGVPLEAMELVLVFESDESFAHLKKIRTNLIRIRIPKRFVNDSLLLLNKCVKFAREGIIALLIFYLRKFHVVIILPYARVRSLVSLAMPVDNSGSSAMLPLVAGRVSNFETRASPSLFAKNKRIARAMNRVRA